MIRLRLYMKNGVGITTLLLWPFLFYGTNAIDKLIIIEILVFNTLLQISFIKGLF